MSPLATFQAAWNRCDQLSALHAYLAAKVTAALQPEEILRAEWAARVSALDLYVHELIAQTSVEILVGTKPAPVGFAKLAIGATNILLSKSNAAAFQSQVDLEIRSNLERRTFQFPTDIADGIRCISDKELWNEIALADGATEATKTTHAKSIKAQLTQIVRRRNKIVHEADLQPAVPRTPWPIAANDVKLVRDFIERMVRYIDALV
jgi:hypothetical protein